MLEARAVDDRSVAGHRTGDAELGAFPVDRWPMMGGVELILPKAQFLDLVGNRQFPCFQQVTSSAEEGFHESMHAQESLCLTWGFEPSHLALSLPRRLVRDFGSVVLVLVGAVDDGWHDLAVSGAVASQLVGDQPVRPAGLTLQQLAEEALSGSPTTTRWDEDVDDAAILIDGTPEILTLALDRDEDLIQVPRVTPPAPPPIEAAGVPRAELDGPKAGSLRRKL